MRLLNIGYGNVVVADRVVAVISPDSAPMKRFKDAAEKAGRLIDGTQGRRTRSILITDSHHIVLSALQTETLAERLDRNGGTPSSQPPCVTPPAVIMNEAELGDLGGEDNGESEGDGDGDGEEGAKEDPERGGEDGGS